MFERRVRIFLFALVLTAVALLARAAQVQVVQAGLWSAVAGDAISRSVLTETTRGRILDWRGRVLAGDVPCNDAAVAYWFVKEEPDEQRLYRDVARKLARRQTPNYQELSRKEQHELVLSCMPQARQQLEEMWNTLARVAGASRADIDAARREIVARVEHRRKQIIMARFQAAQSEHARDFSPWWRRWLLGEADSPPELEDFEEPIAEELQAHVVLPDISSEAYNELRKMQEELPGLVLLASTTRQYPAGIASSHVVGFLGAVGREEMRSDPEVRDPQRAYLPRDLAGKSGIEKLAERALRGTRGRIEQDLETEETTVVAGERPGGDVQTTIDLELQAALRTAFDHVVFRWPDEGDGRGKEETIGPMPGAAVVIDVKTGAIRALVSYPDFDPNRYEEDFARLAGDEINKPLLNRATHSATVPGSTIKPIIGLAAVAEGLLAPHETIQCDGFLYHGGKPLSYLRCWTESMYANMGMNGHQGGADPHPTQGLNPGFDPPPGHLSLADALQRSCNVFFETLAGRLGEERLNRWMSDFGLGRPTGCGLPEHRGAILSDMPQRHRANAEELRSLVWLAGVGQGHVEATPLQMANVMATLARGGVVIRPTLTADDTQQALRHKKDLKLNPQALDMIRRGMEAVVQTPGGTGSSINATLPVEIAGKTGSAQAPALTIVARDQNGTILRDENGKPQRIALAHSTRDSVNPLAPWFRRVNAVSDGQPPRQTHGWFIGYAPAENPKVAFAVLVEYGGSGSVAAASVVTQLMDALDRLEYIEPTRQRDPAAPTGQIRYLVPAR